MYIRLKTDALSDKPGTLRIACLLVAVLLFFACTGCNFIPEEEEIVPPQLIKSVSVQYELYKVARNTLKNELVVDGVFVSSRQYSLSFRLSGYRLKTIYASAGNPVKKGDVIAELDNENIKLRIKYQETEMKKAQLRYRQAEIDYDVLKKDPNSSKASLEKARINLDIMKLDMDILKVQLEELKKEYENTRLVSPIDGTVAYVDASLSEGSWVEAYKTVALVLDPSDLLLECSIPNKALELIRSGMECKVKINKDLYDGVIAVSPDDLPEKIKESKPNVAQIRVKGLTGREKPGDLAAMSVITEIKEDVIVVPRSVIRTFGSRNYVVVLDENGKKEIDVELGMYTSTAVEVISGLREGQDVIIK